MIQLYTEITGSFPLFTNNQRLLNNTLRVHPLIFGKQDVTVHGAARMTAGQRLDSNNRTEREKVFYQE